MKAACWAVAFACFAAGCQQHGRQDTRYALGHVVIFWLKDSGDPETRSRIVRASDGFRSIPGVLRVDAGERVSTARPNVDKTYDVAVVIWFRDREALEQYQVHPKHQAMLRELGPLIDHTVAYDFTRPRMVR